MKNNYFNKINDFYTVKVDDVNKIQRNNIVARKNIIIGWNKNYIYLGLIYNGALEIIQNLNTNDEEKIKYVSLFHGSIFYNDNNYYSSDNNNVEEKDIIEEVLYKKNKNPYSNKDDEDDD